MINTHIAFETAKPGSKVERSYIEYSQELPSLEEIINGHIPSPIKLKNIEQVFKPNPYTESDFVLAILRLIDSTPPLKEAPKELSVFSFYTGTPTDNRKFATKIKTISYLIAATGRIAPAQIVYIHRNNDILIEALKAFMPEGILIIHDHDEFIEKVMLHIDFSKQLDADGSLITLVDNKENPTCFELFPQNISNQVFCLTLEGSMIPYVTRHRSRRNNITELLK